VAVAADVTSVCIELLERIVTPEREIVTVIEGVDAEPEVTAALRAWLADNRSVQVEVHRGGQPLYPYLFGVE
jgi:hypothetical protein